MKVTDEPTLFDVPRSRSTDPETSREAEDRHAGKAWTHTKWVAQQVQLYPGSTAVELWKACGGLDRHEWSRRLPDAERIGLIRRGEPRKCRVRGVKMVTWWPK